MKNTILILTIVITLLIAACHTSKKSSTTTVASSSVTTATVPTSTFMVARKPSNGVYEPGNEELTAILAQYKDETLTKLKEGYKIYATGACTNCHSAENIYKFKESEWKTICDEMAEKAELTATQKDAVFKYVLSIKYANPKEWK